MRGPAVVCPEAAEQWQHHSDLQATITTLSSSIESKIELCVVLCVRVCAVQRLSAVRSLCMCTQPVHVYAA